MFKVKTSKTYFWPIELRVIEDGGKFGKVKFDAEFKRLPEPEFRELMKQWAENQEDRIEYATRKQARLKKIEAGEDVEELDADIEDFGDRQIADRVFVGWKNVADEEGTPLEVNDENKATLLDMLGLPEAVVKAFLDSYKGIREKN